MRVEVRRVHVRARQVEARALPVEAAVADQDDVDGIVGRRRLGEAVDRLLDLLARRAPGRELVALALLIDEVHEPLGRHADLGGRLRERRAPLVEQLAVLRVAGQADDDEEKGLEHLTPDHSQVPTPSPQSA